MWLKTENTRHGDRLNKEKGDISDGKKVSTGGHNQDKKHI
jgi:hypothetical protein